MKTTLKGWLFALFSLLAAPAGAAPAAVDVPAEVHSQNTKFCRAMQLSMLADETGKADDNDIIMARFLMDSDKNYNSLGVQNDKGSAFAEGSVQVDFSGPGHWAFVIDDSDPNGRRRVIGNEIFIASKLLSRLPQNASVGVYSLARDLRLVARDKGKTWVSERKTEEPPVIEIGGEDSTSDATERTLQNAMAGNKTNARYNTNLWVGVHKACEELANQQAGPYSAVPRCLVVFSDGVDESVTSSRDLQELCEYARKHGVIIYTIAFPNKDSGLNLTDMQRGYVGLQALSQETFGFYTSYDTEYDKKTRSDFPTAETVDNVNTLLRKMRHDLRVVSVRLSVRQLLSNQGSITMSLRTSDEDKQPDSVTIPAEYLGQITGYWALRGINSLRAISDDEAEDTMKLVLGAGRAFVDLVYSQQRRKEILDYPKLDKQYAARLRLLCQHLDTHTDIMGEDEQTRALKIGVYLLDDNQALPEAKKPAAPYKKPELPAKKTSILQDWVWIGLAVCVGILLLLGCLLLVRRTLSDEDEAEGTSVPTVTLTNVDNPEESWSCEQSQVRVGRRSGNDIVLPYSSVSGTQCFLNYTPAGVWELRDANSTNGTEVNGKRITGAYPLADGDVIGMAEVKLRFNQQ